MKGNEEDDTGTHSNSSKLLSGSALLRVHINVGKNLPKDGVKDFNPSNSWLEKKQIQSALEERKELLEEERVEKWGCLANAIWDQKKNLAEVTRRTGKHFQTLGFEKEGKLYLYPEEALYLLETNSLELTFGGVPISLQQGYSLLLGLSSGCNLIEYRAYSHLLRQGYRLLRFNNQKIHTKYIHSGCRDQCNPLKCRNPKDTNVKSEKTSKQKTTPASGSYNSAIKQQMDHLEIADQTNTEMEPCEDREERKTVSLAKENEESSATDFSPELIALKTGAILEKSTGSVKTGDGDTCDSVISKVACNQTSKEDTETTEDKLLEDKGVAHKKELSNVQQADEEEDSIGQQERIEATVDHASGVILQQEISIMCLGKECSETTEAVGAEEKKSIEHKKAEELQSIPAEVGTNSNKSEPTCKKGVGRQSQESSGAISVGENSGDNNSPPDIEGAKTKAYDIAESLLSLGNVLVAKDSKVDDRSYNELKRKDLSVTLQSEIMKVLGGHLQTNVSQDALAAVASSAASTILSHLSNSVGDIKEVCQGNVIPSDQNTSKSNEATSEQVITHNLGGDTNMPGSGSCELPSLTNKSVDPIYQDSTLHSNEGHMIVDCLSAPASPSSSIESETAIPSENHKRPASPDQENLGLHKRAKVTDTLDEDIEIIDIVPEEKHVELVNLSDESSLESSHDSKAHADDNSIEVIDIDDTSSSETSDSDSSQSEFDKSDSSVIVEDKACDQWNQERKRILDSIPNMYNLTEISLTPPSPDLLPENVKPQHSHYRIFRGKLLMERKEGSSRHPYTQFSHQRQQLSHACPPFAYNPPQFPPHQVWDHNAPLNPIAAVQAVAQLVLPMLGLPPNAFSADQMWMPSNPWFPPRPSWGPGPRYHLGSTRGNNRQRPFRPRPYGFRNFPARFRHQQRGSVFNYNRSYNMRPIGASEPFRKNELAPCQAIPDNRREQNEDVSPDPTQWGSWMQRRMAMRGEKFRCKKQTTGVQKGQKRCFKFTEVVSIKSDKSSVTCDTNISPSTKTVSDSSDDSSSDSSDVKSLLQNHSSSVYEGSENSGDTYESSLEIKPLLSPNDCTSFASVFKSLKVIKEAGTDCLISNVQGTYKRPKFNIFSPNKPFKKSSPPEADFHLCIVSYDDPLPSPGEIRTLTDALNDLVPIMFAIVSPDAVSFVEFCDIGVLESCSDLIRPPRHQELNFGVKYM